MTCLWPTVCNANVLLFQSFFALTHCYASFIVRISLILSSPLHWFITSPIVSSPWPSIGNRMLLHTCSDEVLALEMSASNSFTASNFHSTLGRFILYNLLHADAVNSSDYRTYRWRINILLKFFFAPYMGVGMVGSYHSYSDVTIFLRVTRLQFGQVLSPKACVTFSHSFVIFSCVTRSCLLKSRLRCIYILCWPTTKLEQNLVTMVS